MFSCLHEKEAKINFKLKMELAGRLQAETKMMQSLIIGYFREFKIF